MMRTALRTLMTLSWALWFGGLVTLFLSATAMFRVSHDLGASANPVLFATFEPYQLILAAVLVLCTALWIPGARSRWLAGMLLVLFLLAGLAATVSWTWITPELEALRLQGLGGSQAFKTAHGRSMLCYSSALLLLLMGGLMLPHADRPRNL